MPSTRYALSHEARTVARPLGATNTERPLTRHLDFTERGMP